MGDGETIQYEGNDFPRSVRVRHPKRVDQPRLLPSGRVIQNGLFAEAVKKLRSGEAKAEPVRVYEQLFPGVWTYKGLFELLDYDFVSDGKRRVFVFRLRAVGDTTQTTNARTGDLPHLRLIPSDVKLEVWKRDAGKCVICGCTDKSPFRS